MNKLRKLDKMQTTLYLVMSVVATVLAGLYFYDADEFFTYNVTLGQFTYWLLVSFVIGYQMFEKLCQTQDNKNTNDSIKTFRLIDAIEAGIYLCAIGFTGWYLLVGTFTAMFSKFALFSNMLWLMPVGVFVVILIYANYKSNLIDRINMENNEEPIFSNNIFE